MNNPTKEGNYTTIFKDGSIIYENPWLVFPDGHGKWYWNEDYRGGVVAWNEIPEGGYIPHVYYKLPRWELKELIELAAGYECLLRNGVDNWEGYDKAWTEIEDQITEEFNYYNKYIVEKT